MARTILRIAQVRARTGLGRTSIYEAVKNGTFPRPVNIGPRAVGWIDTAVDEWIDSRPLTGGAGTSNAKGKGKGSL